ncbi:MFS transporter [Blastococcus sp. VKM Ac-2987]|uniref:MFS transporter n=1 Tax=Blastococcus sp. VKM Ac-2987 TaxID=3004141 RepID=UPI0022ABA1F5|nr:MFS transporter [Blastococcus sp. VKM Ac-2987]MCZ2858265.1 YbfB/YjiJ family MFS transporter [Blastococcus sp. VKM Ac-2987]
MRVAASPGHLAAAGLTAIAVSFAFARYGYGLFLPQFRETFGLSTDTAGLLAAGGYAGYLLALLATGVLVARTGPRLLVLIGTSAATLGAAVIAVAPNTVVLAIGVFVAATSPGWCWAPFSDAVARQVPRDRRHRTLAVITSGTTFGVLVSAPAAWLTTEGSTWRLAWAAFAVLALGAAVWNTLLLAGGPDPQRTDTSVGTSPWHWMRRTGSAPLFLGSAGFGLTSTVYWTYAVDRVASAPDLPDVAAPVFWLLVGGSGIVGTATGYLVATGGLRRTFAVSSMALGMASALLVLPPSWPLVTTSAVLFGSSFMVLSALLVIWSGEVFPERPATGFSAALCALALGAIAGLSLLGGYAEAYGLPLMFAVDAALVIPMVLLRPRFARPAA